MWFSNFISSIKAWFSLPERSDLDVLQFERLEHIEAEDLATKFRLRDEGRRLGEGGVPPANATQLSGPEASAINEVERARRGYQAWAVRRITSLDESIARYDIRHQINTALQAEEVFRRKVSNYLTATDHDLRELRRIVEIESNELANFKLENKLLREAHYPSGSRKLILFSILLLLIIFEGAINGQIFQRGLAGGILEGILYAILFAILNVYTNYKLGASGFIYANHFKSSKQLIGWFSLTFALLISISIGLMLGHFRMALSAQADKVFDLAWESFWASPFNIGGIDSMLLFGVTLLFGFIAFADGYNMDDKYPGFGPQQRRYEDALENYNHEIVEVHDILNEFKTNSNIDMERAVSKSQGALANLSAEVINKRAANDRIVAAMTTSQAAANAAVQIFRADNLLARGEKPYPSYFNTDPSLATIDIPNFDITNDLATQDEMGKLVQKLIANAQEIRGKIETSFNEQYDQLKPITGQFNRS